MEAAGSKAGAIAAHGSNPDIGTKAVNCKQQEWPTPWPDPDQILPPSGWTPKRSIIGIPTKSIRSQVKNFIQPFVLHVKSTQFKKFAPSGSHIEIWNLTNHMKKHETKNIRLLVFSFSILFAFWYFLFSFFHLVFEISNFNMWITKHLAHTSCAELTLPWVF